MVQSKLPAQEDVMAVGLLFLQFSASHPNMLEMLQLMQELRTQDVGLCLCHGDRGVMRWQVSGVQGTFLFGKLMKQEEMGSLPVPRVLTGTLIPRYLTSSKRSPARHSRQPNEGGKCQRHKRSTSQRTRLASGATSVRMVGSFAFKRSSD